MTRRHFLTAVLLASAACRPRPSAPRPAALAFSLREAERRLSRGAGAGADVTQLAGIRRLLGVVVDRAARDVVVAGRVDPAAEPLALDDLVVAMRARLVHSEWPLVSIDKTPETRATGRQRVRFDGHIAGTPFGDKLLAADVVLKRAALGRPPAQDIGIPSYFRMCADAAQRGLDPGSVSSRLWFHAAEASLLARDDVFVIRDLRVGVRTAVVADGADERDAIGDEFAAALTRRYDDLSARFPEIARLGPLFHMVALAKGLEPVQGVDLTYWTHRHPVRAVHTPGEHPLERREETIVANGETRVLEVDGGIDTRMLLRRLRDGDHTAFREAVLQTRPAPDALAWPVPLAAWRATATGTSAGADIDARSLPGAHLERRIVLPPVAGPGGDRGGVAADIKIDPRDFAGKPQPR